MTPKFKTKELDKQKLTGKGQGTSFQRCAKYIDFISGVWR